MSEPEFAGPEDKMLPWGRRTRAIPLRTYTGTVKYPRQSRGFTIKDYERITNSINFGGVADTRDSWQKILDTMKRVTLLMLEKILPFLDEGQISQLYDFVQQFLIEVFKLERDIIPLNRSKAEDIIYRIAAQNRLEVTIKRL